MTHEGRRDAVTGVPSHGVWNYSSKSLLKLVFLMSLFLAVNSANTAILPPSDCDGLLAPNVCNFDPRTGLHWVD